MRLPAAPGRGPAALPVLAGTKLQVERFPGGVVEDERYRIEFRPSAAVSAALVAALAGAATQIEVLDRSGSPDEPVILNVAIWG